MKTSRCVPRVGVALLLTIASAGAAGSAPADARVRELLAKMTLEEKVGQLSQFSGPDHADKVEAGHVGSLLSVEGAAKVNALQKIAVEKTRLHIPILFG